MLPCRSGPRGCKGSSEPGPCQGGASGQRSRQVRAEPGSVFQDSDLKQYLDHCGNLMSMHNVKVRASVRAAYPWVPHFSPHLFSSPTQAPVLTTRGPAARLLRPFKV